MDILVRHAWARPALLVALLLLPAVYLPALSPWLAATLVAVLAVLAALRRRSGSVGPVRLEALLLAALLALGFWALRTGPSPPDTWAFLPAQVEGGRGQVVAEAGLSRRGSAPFRFAVSRVRGPLGEGSARATVTVLGYPGSSPPQGSVWVFRGRLGPGGVLYWQSGRQVGWAAPWWSWRAGFRSGLLAALAPLGEAPAALGAALLIGAADDLSPAEKDAFRLAGCSHVLALSGMHLSLLALLLQAGLQRRAPPLLVFVVVQGVLAAFCLLAGPIPSLWRAWVMAGLGGLWALRRRPVPLQELLAQSFVASVLLWPDLARTLSFQLSFLALAGLFWGSAPTERLLRPGLGRWAAAQLGPSAAALAATAPLTLALFGELRWVGILLTPPLVLLTTVHLAACGVAALVGSALPAVPLRVVAPAFEALYQAIFTCTGWGRGVPALGPLTAGLLLGAAALGSGLAFRYNQRRRKAPVPEGVNYDSPAALQALLESRGFNALKRWGQNFLINAGARRQILAALELRPGEPVWEIGPGLGALTHHLVGGGHPLTVFEIDPGYCAFLADEFGSAPAGFTVVPGDVVKTWRQAAGAGAKTVGNLPYNAASAIIAAFVEGGLFPQVFVVTVQLEMAQRMASAVNLKSYSSFSVLCQAVFQVEEVVTLRPGSFYPPPGVTSRVVRLRPHGLYPGLDLKRFSAFVRECFASRRKTLRNNLPRAAAALNLGEDAVTAAFTEAGIDVGRRAESLGVAAFVDVFTRAGPASSSRS